MGTFWCASIFHVNPLEPGLLVMQRSPGEPLLVLCRLHHAAVPLASASGARPVGIFEILPRKVIAWTSFVDDSTKFALVSDQKLWAGCQRDGALDCPSRTRGRRALPHFNCCESCDGAPRLGRVAGILNR